MAYQERIKAIVPRANPRHVEAWLRSEHGTLDALSPERFAYEAHEAANMAAADPDMSEKLAQSFGITADAK